MGAKVRLVRIDGNRVADVLIPFHIVGMMRVDDQQLVMLALAVLEEAYARAVDAPQPAGRPIRLALATMKRRACAPGTRPSGPTEIRPEGEGNPFAHFWNFIDEPHQPTRMQMLNHALGAIYLLAGMDRARLDVSRFKEECAA